MSSHSLFSVLRPLEHKRYRLLVGCMTASLLGGGAWNIALVSLVVSMEGGPAELSIVTTAFSIGMTIGLPFAGVLADRLSRRRVIMTVELVRGVAALLTGTIAMLGAAQISVLASAALVAGGAQALFIPAYSAYVPSVLPPEHLYAANGLEGVLRPVAHQAVGPLLGGAVAAASAAHAIMVAGAAHLLATLLVLPLVESPHEAASRPKADRQTFLADMRDGVAYACRTPWVLGSMLFGTIYVTVVFGPLYVLGPFVVVDRLGASATQYGFVLSAFGIGAAAGALSVSTRQFPRRYLTAMLLIWGGGALPLATFGVARSLWILLVSAGVIGTTGSAAAVIWGTLLQRRVPAHLRGRVSGLDFFVSLAFMPVSMSLAGRLGDMIGYTMIFAVSGIVPILAAITVLRAARLDRDELINPLRPNGRGVSQGPRDAECQRTCSSET